MITSTDAIILDEVCSTKKKPTRVKMNNGQKKKSKCTTEKCKSEKKCKKSNRCVDNRAR